MSNHATQQLHGRHHRLTELFITDDKAFAECHKEKIITKFYTRPSNVRRLSDGEALDVAKSFMEKSVIGWAIEGDDNVQLFANAIMDAMLKPYDEGLESSQAMDAALDKIDTPKEGG